MIVALKKRQTINKRMNLNVHIFVHLTSYYNSMCLSCVVSVLFILPIVLRWPHMSMSFIFLCLIRHHSFHVSTQYSDTWH